MTTKKATTKKATTKKPKAKEPRIPGVGDRVIPRNSTTVYTIWHVSADNTEVHLELKGTLLERYRVPVRDLTWVEEE